MGPIRLTPEILENVFGFSYIPALYTHVLNIRNLDDVSYQHGMVFYAGHRVSDFSFPYVHELQNIYYLISKKELPVNLGYATTRIKKINQ